MSILITGVAGFIGFHTALSLIEDKNKIIGIDNLNNYYDVGLKKNRLKILNKYKNHFKFYRTDIANEVKIRSIFKKHKIDFVINLAAQAGVRYSLKKPKEYLKSNIIGFFNLINISKDFSVKRFVYASTSSVYGNNLKTPFYEKDTADHPIQFYAATKRSNELIAHAYSSLFKMETVGLRFFTVYGPWGRPDMALFKFVKNISNNKPISVYNFGNHIRDFTYIDDIVKGIKLVKNSSKIFKIKSTKNNFSPDTSNVKFEIFNIGSGKSTTLLNYIQIIEKELKKKSKKNFFPLQRGDIKKTLSNVSKLKKIGYKPTVEPKEGIKKFINWYKHYYKIN